MTTCHVFIACSLDGFIATEDGGIDWLDALPDIGTDYGYAAFMSGMDGLVMGRGTFEKVLGFGDWPYDKPVIVMSQTLPGVPAHLAGKVSLSRETPHELVARLAQEGWQRAYIDGGQLISAFLSAGLIADMIFSRVPVLLGQGLPLFHPVFAQTALEHVSTEAFESGLVQSTYRVRESG